MENMRSVSSELNSKSFLLSGGTAILSNSDMNNYIEIGNYYASSEIAQSLQNAPFNRSFTMKIDYGNGTGYICQTYREIDTGRVAIRYNNNQVANAEQWQPYAYFSGDIGAEQYMFTAQAEYTADCNDLTQPGFYKKIITPNNGHSPGFYAYILVLKGVNYEGTKSHFTQVAFPYNSSNQIVSRHGEGDTWSEWT